MFAEEGAAKVLLESGFLRHFCVISESFVKLRSLLEADEEEIQELLALLCCAFFAGWPAADPLGAPSGSEAGCRASGRGVPRLRRGKRMKESSRRPRRRECRAGL